ncbi:hypothetical protein FNF28_06908 [Cafeteria roenbergensis]|uniref:Uncharacterized protein n=1 Tax=Cafeteria roenbergensis TaxID=33653 RepID=A0A5A8CKZ6_CAFRO|nr:hypothetical protein FNF28_06908 [Cafeteria roenbergensis]
MLDELEGRVLEKLRAGQALAAAADQKAAADAAAVKAAHAAAASEEAARRKAAAEEEEAARRKAAAAEEEEEAARRKAAAEEEEAARRKAAAEEEEEAARRKAAAEEATARIKAAEEEEAARRKAAAEEDEAARRKAAAEEEEAARRKAAAEEEEAARRKAAAEEEEAARRKAAAEEATARIKAAEEEEAARRKAAAEEEEAARRKAAAEEATTRIKAAEEEEASRRKAAAEEEEAARRKAAAEEEASQEEAAARPDAQADSAPSQADEVPRPDAAGDSIRERGTAAVRRASTVAAAAAAAADAIRELPQGVPTLPSPSLAHPSSHGEAVAAVRSTRSDGPPQGSRLAPLAVAGMDGTLRPETLGDVIPAATLGMRPPWLASQLPHSARLPFGPGDGFDVYVDRAVFCPDNLGMSKVVFKLMDASYTVLGDPMEKASRLDCSLIEPEYGAHSAFRPGLASVHSRGAELGSSGRLSEGASAAEDADHGPASLAGRTEQEAWDWDPSLTLVFRIDGLDAHTHKLHAAGYAVLNVFTTDDPDVGPDGRPVPTGMESPSSSTPRSKWRLNAGAFQLPLHMGPPDRRNHPMSGRVLEDSGVLRVPCATLLVRIVKAPRRVNLAPQVRPFGTQEYLAQCACREDVAPELWAACGLDEPAPDYQLHTYDSSRSVPRAGEVGLYPRRLDLDVPTVRQVIALFAAERTEGKVTRGLEDIPSPIATDDVILQWLNDVLDKLPLSMLDFRYICPYSSEEGLCVSVDGVSNSPLGKLLRVACCPIAGARSDPVPLLSGTAARRSSKRRGAGEPRLLGRNSKVTSLALEAGEMGAPAEWLAPKQQATGDPAAAIEDEAGPASDATPWFACHEANWAAPQSLQAFRDDFVHLREPFHPTTCLFFRLFAAEPFAGGHSVQVEAVGWAVMPVFDKRGDGYTRRGAFVVPVLAGPAPPPWLVERLAADPTKIDSLIKDLVAGTTGERDAPPPLLIPPSEPVSILVRLQDGQLSDLIPIPTSKYSAALVPKPVRSRFQLSARMPYHRQQARLSVTLPRDLSPSDADEALVRAVRAIVEGRAPSPCVLPIRKQSASSASFSLASAAAAAGSEAVSPSPMAAAAPLRRTSAQPEGASLLEPDAVDQAVASPSSEAAATVDASALTRATDAPLSPFAASPVKEQRSSRSLPQFSSESASPMMAQRQHVGDKADCPDDHTAPQQSRSPQLSEEPALGSSGRAPSGIFVHSVAGLRSATRLQRASRVVGAAGMFRRLGAARGRV